MTDADFLRSLQIGQVHSVNRTKHLARVKFPETEIVSDWLSVLDTRPFIPDYDGEQKTETEEDSAEGDEAFREHAHKLTIKQWMPRVGDVVLCAFLPYRNSAGFILGRIDNS